MEIGIFYIVGLLWWSFAIVVVALLIRDGSNSLSDLAVNVAVSVLWPILVMTGLVMFTYQACTMSVEQIRADLHNRKLLKEFEKFIADRK